MQKSRKGIGLYSILITGITNYTNSIYRSKDGRPHKHRHHHHHHEQYKQEDLLLRRQKGSEVRLDKRLQRVPTEADEANLLHTADLDEMASMFCVCYGGPTWGILEP